MAVEEEKAWASVQTAMKMIITLLHYLQLLLSCTAIALGVNKFRNYWNRKKNDLHLYILFVSLGFTIVNLMVQQLMAVFAKYYSYDSQYAWVAFAASFCHLLGAVFLYSVFRSWLQSVNVVAALMLLGLAGIRIIFELDTRATAFLLCQLWVLVAS